MQWANFCRRNRGTLIKPNQTKPNQTKDLNCVGINILSYDGPQSNATDWRPDSEVRDTCLFMWTLDVAQLSVSTVDLSPHSKAYFCVIRQLWCGDLIMVWDRCFATTMQQINKREKDGSPARSRWSLTLSPAGSRWLWWPPEASPGLSPAWSAPGTMVIKSVLCATWFLPLSPGRSELDDNSTAPELRLAPSKTPATD